MKIIAVDDELHALNSIKESIKNVVPDAEVKTFGRGDSALEYAKEHAVDVAFLDINMPVMSGIELAKELKRVNPRINIIFCTAYGDYAVDAIRLHASGYVLKPYNDSQVAAELDNLLHPLSGAMPRIYARCFGDFDLFIDGEAVVFSRSKSKELLAYLVSKNGGLVSRKDLAAAMFQDDYSAKTQNYLVKLYNELVKTLKKHGAENILVKGFNQYGVNVNNFGCDFYEYKKGEPQAINAYKGEFMAQYEWAELY